MENDHRSFSLKDCLDISQERGVPILLDAFHHKLLNNGESLKEAALSASKTWKKKDGVPLMDFSEQARNKKRGAHSDYINKRNFEEFLKETKGIKKDIMLEAKNKEKALLRLKI